MTRPTIVHLEVSDHNDGGLLCGRLSELPFLLVVIGEEAEEPEAQEPGQRLCATCLRLWQRAQQAWHEDDDPHCTCNDCIESHARHTEVEP